MQISHDEMIIYFTKNLLSIKAHNLSLGYLSGYSSGIAMRPLIVIILFTFPFHSEEKLLNTDSYGLFLTTAGRKAAASQAEAIEMEAVGDVAAESAVEVGAATLAESAIALAPAFPILLLFSGALILGGFAIHEFEQSQAHARTITNTQEEKPREKIKK